MTMSNTTRLNFTQWINENKQLIESELISKATSFINYNSPITLKSEIILDDHFHYLTTDKKNGYVGRIHYTDKQVPRLTLTLNHFKDGSVTFTDTVVDDLWNEYKAQFATATTSDKPKYTIEQALADYQHAAPVTNHPYLIKKQVSDSPISDDLNVRFLPSKNALLIPLVNADLAIQSVQLIYADGFKHNPLGAKKKGGFYPIGESPKTASKIVIVGGFAHSLSLYQAKTAPCVINAIDDGNLFYVGEIIQSMNPHAEMILASDDDHINESKGKGNSGLDKGRIAAQKLGVKYTYPDRDKLGNGSDFNDVHCTQGIDAVLEQFQANLSLPVATTDKPQQIPNTDIEQKGAVVHSDKNDLAPTDKDLNIQWPNKFLKIAGSLLFDTGRIDKQNKPIYKLTYHGFFQPTALHINADTGDTWVAIEFDCESGIKTVIAKQSDLATKSTIIKTLTSKGAFITESNAALCCDFISSFLSFNRGNL